MPESLHMPPSAALFDLDGTLVRTFIDFAGMRRAMRVLSMRHGLTDVIDGNDDILDMVARMAAAQGGEQGNALQREAFAILEAMEVEGCSKARSIPGVTELLTGLRAQGSKVAIITRNCRGVAEDLTQRMDLAHDFMVAREDTTEFKPHPAPLLLALRCFGIPPKEAIMAGDLWADIAAGKAAGVGLTIGIQWPHDPPQRFSRCPPDIEVNSIAALRPLLLPVSC